MSGDFKPRLLISSLLSTFILPLEVKVYLTVASSATRSSLLGILQSLFSSHALVLYQSSALKFKYVCPILGLSETLIPRTGSPNSFRRSTTPAPNPIESTRISLGFCLWSQASKFATTAPHSCMRSRFLQRVRSTTTLLCLLHRTEESEPKRATSSPQMMGEST